MEVRPWGGGGAEGLGLEVLVRLGDLVDALLHVGVPRRDAASVGQQPHQAAPPVVFVLVGLGVVSFWRNPEQLQQHGGQGPLHDGPNS